MKHSLQYHAPQDSVSSLYVHVPFCPHICPYCDFHKMRRHEGLVAAYLNWLETDIKNYHHAYSKAELQTIYMGGGTPSHLQDDELARVFQAIADTWGVARAQEITIEADPLTFDVARLKTWRAWGINRLSIGLQSTQAQVLRYLGRQHTPEQGLHAVQLAQEAGFDVSADIITAVSNGQVVQDVARDLHTLAQAGVGHISVYNLTIEPYTPFGLRGLLVDETQELSDYLLTEEVLSGYGYERYEVSSHAQPNKRAKHNQVYWQGKYFIALGPSAAGFLPRLPLGLEDVENADVLGYRYTVPIIKHWLEQRPAKITPVTPLMYVEDLLMTGLRTLDGVNVLEAEARTGIDIMVYYAPVFETFLEQSLLQYEKPYLRASSQGILQLNQILRAVFAHQ